MECLVVLVVQCAAGSTIASSNASTSGSSSLSRRPGGQSAGSPSSAHRISLSVAPSLRTSDAACRSDSACFSALLVSCVCLRRCHEALPWWRTIRRRQSSPRLHLYAERAEPISGRASSLVALSRVGGGVRTNERRELMPHLTFVGRAQRVR